MIFIVDTGREASIMPVMDAAFDPAFGEAWTLDQCRSALAIPGTCLLGYGPQERPDGFALVRTLLDEAELLLLGVRPSAQRTGIGRALVAAVIDHARELGAAKLFLEVRETNNARRFYTIMGFSETGRRKDYYRSKTGNCSDAVTLARAIL